MCSILTSSLHTNILYNGTRMCGHEYKQIVKVLFGEGETLFILQHLAMNCINKREKWLSNHHPMCDFTLSVCLIISLIHCHCLLLYTPYISWISWFGCYPQIEQHAKLFTSDPDAWMRLVYAILVVHTQYTVHVQMSEWYWFLRPLLSSSIANLTTHKMSWSPDSWKIRLAKYMAYTVYLQYLVIVMKTFW